MNKLLFNLLRTTLAFIPILVLLTISSCDKDDEPTPEPDPDPIASFQFEISTDNFLEVTFTNFSQNATSYSWDFGDGNSSTDKDPVHTYGAGGDFTVTLTASNASGKSAQKSESFTLTDPNAALKLLTGEESKTWKLFREGTSMSLGPNAESPAEWWSGLTNDGTRPCLYEQEFTFSLDGTYQFDDKGMFWGEFGVWGGGNCPSSTDLLETCFEATAANMVNCNGDDVSAWLSGSHAFTYDPSTSTLSLAGLGSWIGIPKLTTSGESLVPVSSTDAQITIEQFEGYDVMTVAFDYGEGGYWPIKYASYSDPSLEPELQTEGPGPFGVDLEDASPSELFNSFASDTAAFSIDTIQSASTLVYGVNDPADSTAEKVGQFNRTDAQFQELQFQTSPVKQDINFENLTTVSLDVYLPSTNDYSGSLSNTVIIGFGDKSATEQWWTDNYEFVINDNATDEWVTLSLSLDATNAGAGAGTIYERNDLDMFYIQIGGGNHTDTGTFYVRNFKFE